jgi:ATP-binding cassette, subfamily B, multidrug efflux pump
VRCMEKEKVSSGNIIDWKVLKRILKFITPYRGRFYFLILLTVLLGLLTPLRPLLIQYTLDAHVAAGKYWDMVNVMLLILALLVLQSVVQYVHTYIYNSMSILSVFDCDFLIRLLLED